MRQDISLAQQLVQSNHATFEVARRLPFDPNSFPSVVVIGVPDKNALLRVISKLTTNNLQFQTFEEPDFDMGLSAVATVPLDETQRRVLGNYRLWKLENTTVKETYERSN